jgi:hypothetical protein
MSVSRLSNVGLNFISNDATCPAETSVKSVKPPDSHVLSCKLSSAALRVLPEISLVFRRTAAIHFYGIPIPGGVKPLFGKVSGTAPFIGILEKLPCIICFWYTIFSPVGKAKCWECVD